MWRQSAITLRIKAALSASCLRVLPFPCLASASCGCDQRSCCAMREMLLGSSLSIRATCWDLRIGSVLTTARSQDNAVSDMRFMRLLIESRTTNEPSDPGIRTIKSHSRSSTLTSTADPTSLSGLKPGRSTSTRTRVTCGHYATRDHLQRDAVIATVTRSANVLGVISALTGYVDVRHSSCIVCQPGASKTVALPPPSR